MKLHEVYLREYLTADQKAEYTQYKMNNAARSATDHFFGVGNDVVRRNLPEILPSAKSTIQKAIEKEIGQEISISDYLRGLVKDRYGREVKIGRLIKDEKLRNQFASDPARQGVRTTGYYLTVHRGTEVAGQTNEVPDERHPTGHSWEAQSCKNIVCGSNRRYLKNEIQAGTVVCFVHEPSGKEIYRATLHPYTNRDNQYRYHLDAEYGVKNSVFTDQVKEVAVALSHKGAPSHPVYTAPHNVYLDSGRHRIVDFTGIKDGAHAFQIFATARDALLEREIFTKFAKNRDFQRTFFAKLDNLHLVSTILALDMIMMSPLALAKDSIDRYLSSIEDTDLDFWALARHSMHSPAYNSANIKYVVSKLLAMTPEVYKNMTLDNYHDFTVALANVCLSGRMKNSIELIGPILDEAIDLSQDFRLARNLPFIAMKEITSNFTIANKLILTYPDKMIKFYDMLSTALPHQSTSARLSAAGMLMNLKQPLDRNVMRSILRVVLPMFSSIPDTLRRIKPAVLDGAVELCQDILDQEKDPEIKDKMASGLTALKSVSEAHTRRRAKKKAG